MSGCAEIPEKVEVFKEFILLEVAPVSLAVELLIYFNPEGHKFESHLKLGWFWKAFSLRWISNSTIKSVNYSLCAEESSLLEST